MEDPPPGPGSPPGSDRRALCHVALVGATFAVCLVRLAGFVKDNAVNLLFEDQWDFLKPLFDGKGPWDCFFWQHGPHRQGLGGLIDWFLYRVTDWDVRADAWAAVVVLTLTAIAAVALASRLRGRLSWSDAGFPLLLLGPIHWETMVLTPNLAHSILPLFFTVMLANAWISSGLIPRVLGVGLFGALTLFTGYGSCGVPVTASLALLLWLRARSGKMDAEQRPAILILALLGVAAVVFAWGYHWDRGTPVWRFPMPNWWDYPRFCALMFTSLLGLRSVYAATLAHGHVANTMSPLVQQVVSAALVAVGAMLLALVVGVFLAAAVRMWRREAPARAKAVWVLSGTSLLYAGLTAFGRLPITIQAAFMGRYLTLLTPAVCGLAIAAEAGSMVRHRSLGRCLLIGWVALASVIWCDFSPERNASAIAMAKHRWIASYLKTRDLSAANKESAFLVYYPDPASPIIAGRLRWLEQRRLSFFRDEEKKPAGPDTPR
ncbi:MAG: hypothetical protein ABSG50_12600 [Opitutaceae bacterium]|jgi:hypothetical protein